jgi:hypothetical protein
MVLVRDTRLASEKPAKISINDYLVFFGSLPNGMI